MILTLIQVTFVVFPILFFGLFGEIGFVVGTILSSGIVCVLANLTKTRVFIVQMVAIVIIWAFCWRFYQWHMLSLAISTGFWAIFLGTFKFRNREPKKI